MEHKDKHPVAVVERSGLVDEYGHLFPDPTLHDRIGGADVIKAIVNGLYDRIAVDPVLRVVFPDRLRRAEPADFFTEWMGGERLYTSSGWNWESMQGLHFSFAITKKAAGLWLSFFKQSMEELGIRKKLVKEVMDSLTPLALGMINEDDDSFDPSELRGSCAGNLSQQAWELDRVSALAYRGKLDEVRQSLRVFPNLIHKRTEHGRTLLWEAARGGRAEMVEFLLDEGADIHVPGSLPYKANFPFNPPRSPETLVPLTPYTVARWLNRKRVIRLLEERDAKDDIFSCAFLGDLEGMKAIVADDPDAINEHDMATDFDVVTPLHHAAAGEQIEATKWLIQNGADTGANSQTLITMAVRRNHLPLVKLLIESDVDANDSWLPGIVTEEDSAVADLLVKHGFDLDKASLWPPLIVRVSRGDAGGDPVLHVRWLIENGADINARNYSGHTALHYAARGFDLELTRLLLENGADPDVRNQDGLVPLSLMHSSRATSDGTPVMQLLLDHGADIEAKDASGATSLLYAVRKNRVSAVRCLLKNGADPNCHDSKGASALALAKRGRKKESQEIG
ncbi:MAG: ankyrin repeat domain-containing protein, partial [Planctomycetota bacterium]|nr:ankyrin repeat domain-containing protein [Planctomycetota bacterium]